MMLPPTKNSRYYRKFWKQQAFRVSLARYRSFGDFWGLFLLISRFERRVSLCTKILAKIVPNY